ncbi:FxSxx-COOH cyclophane-containing RiPP peptide [Actinomadura macrotermitis]|uniref:FXSXX-COOH protein n=1 Tax=Actinomadura macrotermitis TaxID=2585200 RepID=A0A7K0C8C4_9ACTN|nr:FxSxx-COOH cyclophane-containing RiPP peptide [Actinomadura macrotermitis]MQY09044.1 hypothetical protein [Actinomadura macrotermitis]
MGDATTPQDGPLDLGGIPLSRLGELGDTVLARELRKVRDEAGAPVQAIAGFQAKLGPPPEISGAASPGPETGTAGGEE